MRAQGRLTARAPAPASESGSGSGGTGTLNLSHAVQSVARPGTSSIARQSHADPRPGDCAPAKRQHDQEVDRGVLEEVDAVREQRHRADRQRHRELDAEIGEVEQGHPTDDFAGARREAVAYTFIG